MNWLFFFPGVKSFKAVKTPRDVDRKLYAFLPSPSKGRISFDGANVLLNPVRFLSEGTDKSPGNGTVHVICGWADIQVWLLGGLVNLSETKQNWWE